MHMCITINHYANHSASSVQTWNKDDFRSICTFSSSLYWFATPKLTSVLLNAFKAVCKFSPYKPHEIKPDYAALYSLSVFPFLKPPALAAMKDEYPQ